MDRGAWSIRVRKNWTAMKQLSTYIQWVYLDIIKEALYFNFYVWLTYPSAAPPSPHPRLHAHIHLPIVETDYSVYNFNLGLSPFIYLFILMFLPLPPLYLLQHCLTYFPFIKDFSPRCFQCGSL